ncbi:MAG TPA: cell wall hydrolase [Sphingomonas sp.]|nr:cell wall hydrolase [Sphingomonas sp.]
MHQPRTTPALAPPSGASARVRVVLVLIAIVAIALPTLVVTLAPPLPVEKAAHRVPKPHVVPPAELPPVEPLRLVDLTPDEARAYNASIPFSTAPNPAARPFHLTGAEADQQRAIACMAAAEVYEAGDDAAGEKAVAQVVLNRLRHPAFPKTVCGVVFQGSDRAAGCQFTFTCDGALDRWKPTDAAWDRARSIASKALNGAVDKAVGYATHYHTDWVVPYWSASLDKIARVGAHLFFRWSGWWGTPPAFNRHVDDDEPVIALLAPLSPAHAADPPGADDALPLNAAAIANGGLPKPLAGDPDTFFVTLDPDWPADSLTALAAASCGDRPYCKFMAWRAKADTPATQPITPQQIATMAFSYLRDTPHGYDKPLWNCATFARSDTAQCMKRQPVPAPSPKVLAVAPLPAPKPTPDGLAGVYWKLDAAASASAPSH